MLIQPSFVAVTIALSSIRNIFWGWTVGLPQIGFIAFAFTCFLVEVVRKLTSLLAVA